MSDKYIGYFLLILGILIISFSTLNIILLFSKKTSPVEFFNFPGVSLDLGGATNLELPENTPTEALSLLEKSAPPEKQEIIPGNLLNQTGNLLAHIIFMGFLVNVGFKIASIGASMTKTIKVNVKEPDQKLL